MLELGLAIFFLSHLLIFTSLRTAVVDGIGEGPFKGLFALLSLGGLVLIVLGYQAAPYEQVFQPVLASREIAGLIMLVAVILVVASNIPSNIQRIVRHPMLLGVTLWAGVHLAVNGDLASSLIFAGFGAYSLIAMVLSSSKPQDPKPITRDILVVGVGVLVYLGLFMGHEYFTGVPLA